MDSGTGEDVTEEGKLGDTAVLDLDVTETVETLLVDVAVEKAEGIEESKRGLDSKLVLEGVEGGGLDRTLLGRGEGGGGGDKGGEYGKLHLEDCLRSKNCEGFDCC
mmetsp:Transcript_28957/g.63792  ORF Transcript_28957/g.63792 Transcript_28957/m.63792 type:complete len:106 (-) Transcript_28957:17-334(-)